MNAIFPFPLLPDHRYFLCKQLRDFSLFVSMEMTDEELYAEVVRLHHRYRSWMAPPAKAAALPPPAAPPAPVLPHGNSRAARQLRQMTARTPADALSAYGDFVPWD